MGRVLASKFLQTGGGLTRTSALPNSVLIAVGPTTIYAFKYTPKGFKIKLKSGSGVARWPQSSIDVQAGKTGAVSAFTLVTDQGEIYDLEVTTALGGAGASELFLNSLQTPAP